MNYKKKSLILSLFIIIIIQIALLFTNKQKSSFRYFIWKIQDISVGKLINVSFISGLLISSILNRTLNNDFKNYSINAEDDKTIEENDYSVNTKDSNEYIEIPPEIDLRDTQPTISVNYRVIKDNGGNEFQNTSQTSKNPKHEDDWNNNDSEW